MGRTAANATADTRRTRWPRRRRVGADPYATRPVPGRQSLQGKILSRALLISVVPLLLISSVTLGSLLGLSNSAASNLEASRQELGRDVAGRSVRASAVGVAREMEQLLAERIDDLVGLAETPDLRRAARRSADDVGDALAAEPTDELEEQFDRDLRLHPDSAIERFVRATIRRQPMISELFFTERNGLTVATSGRTSDFVQRDETWWNRAWDDGLFLGAVELDESSESVGLTVAVRIDSSSGDPLGVLKAVVDIGLLQQIATRTADDTDTDVTLLTSDGRLLAETRTNHAPSRIATPDVELDDERAESAQAAMERSEPGFVLLDTVVAGFAPVTVPDGRLATLLDGFGDVDVEPVQWVAVVEQSNDAAFAPLRGLAGVQRGLSATARTFVIIILVTLLAALLTAFVVSTRLAQSIVGPLRSLGAVSRDIAERQLPALVRRAQHTDGDDELPSVPAVQLRTNDEIEDVSDAFNIVSSTAAGLAAEQARNRRNVARLFVSLGRRNQNLLSRQLEFIDRLERDTSDPDLLEDLFRLDHLATRMRRNAESLLVLAGEDPPRRWSEPVSLTDVVRGAVAEIEDYQRVNVDGVDEASLVGNAVSDVTHLLAELIENAARFSPPDSEVAIVGRRVVDGYALAVVDDGVGMSEEQLDDANRRLEASPLVDRVPSSYLGLFVVGRLAARYDIKVRLVESTTEGVTAKVLLPTALVEPLPRSAARRELTDVERRPALDPGTPAHVGGGHPQLARAGHASADASTAVIDAPAAPPASGGAGDEDETRALGPRRRRRDRAIGRRAGDRGLQIDLREHGDEPEGPLPASRTSPGGPGGAPPTGAPDDGSPGGDEPHADNETRVTAELDVIGDAPRAPAGDDPTGAEADVDDEHDGSEDDARDEHAPQDMRSSVQEAPSRPVVEVRRRTSKRTAGANTTSGAGAADSRAVLRTETPPDAAPADTDEPQRAASAEPVTAPEVVEQDGIALTAPEREARAARERLARFQRAVQRGRAQSKSRHNGGEHHDA
ncbi:MAG: hypothetical protein KY460_13900 [Actinobacteria bacterium]|nr:hypothetical protein [Actinomycetota bacterium]